MTAQDTLAALLEAARRAGADAADALLVHGASLHVTRRLGAIEQLERAEGVDLGLRVFLGARVATVSGSDASPAGFAALAGRAVAMARVVPEDALTLLAEAPPPPALALDLDDGQEPSAEALLDAAARAEDAALAVPGVTNSEGASAGWGRTRRALATSRGFFGEYARSSHSLSATALAGAGTAMQRDYDYTSATHLHDLDAPELIGRQAGEQAVARLDPVRPPSAKGVAVVYHPRVAGSLLGHLAAALNGAAVARRTSFLQDAMGGRVLPAGLSLLDDPLRPRGPRSRPFDGEGQPGARRAMVEDGVLRSWFLDGRSARQLGLASTGHAARGTGGPPAPSPTNLWLEGGQGTPEALMADIRDGIYVTELIGMGVNGVTGDYSRGAAGFRIRDGRLAEAVSEITIAGNLKDMFLRLRAAGDLRFRRGTDAPTLRVDGMTLAGA
ncbi:TldD/PmbA family protein [Roseococcus sp. DSY-14]|uniref:TldD/PmbA family protein n=1 Tax=Roseococcus sp. DSY-14 TaxID=3369650 RepID=UPI00387AA9C2